LIEGKKMASTTQNSKPELAGVIGYFNDPADLVKMARLTREAKYQYFDVYTPYPIHGMEAAQGIKRSPIPFITFIAGLTGGICAFSLEYWTSAVDWPLNVGGKPFNSWPAFIPVTFELTVLFAGLATAGAMIVFNCLPNLRKRVYDTRLMNDRFAIVIEAPDAPGPDDDEKAIARAKKKSAGFKEFKESEVTEFLKKQGATEVRTVFNEGWF
jgi:Protein of unknown function (DUF3341)